MRIIVALLLFLPVVLSAQRTTNRYMTLRCYVAQIGSSDGKPVVTGNCVDYAGTYDATDISVGDTLFFADGGYGFKVPIDSILSPGAPTSTFRVDMTGLDTLIQYVPTGTAAVYGVNSSGRNATVAGLSDSENQYLMEDFVTQVPQGGGIDSFNSNRPILRLYSVGTVVGGYTMTDMFEWLYFAPPTLSLSMSPTATVYEVGTSTSVTLSGSTTNPGAATLSGGELVRTVPSSNVVNSFGGGTTYTSTITFTPTKGGTGDYNLLSYSFRAEQDWLKGAESGTAISTTRSLTAVYPVLYGMTATDLSAGGDAYAELTKLVQTEGDKSVTFTGTAQFMYYAIPKTWGDFNLSVIKDHSNFDVTPSFTAYDITVTSSGLVNNWTQDYKIYKLNSLTNASGFTYQFIR